MPQVITGFDRFAQSQRQKKQDERTATLQDAQETRAVAQEGRAASAFQAALAKETRDTARDKVTQAQTDELFALKKQEMETGILREVITTDFAIGGGQRSLDGPGRALRILLPEPEKFAEGSFYEPTFDDNGNPSGFRFYSPDGDTYFAGINDPEALAPAGKRIAAGEGPKYFSAQYGSNDKGEPVAIFSASDGSVKVEPLPDGATPFSAQEKPEGGLSPAEQKTTKGMQWEDFFNTTFSMKLPTSAAEFDEFAKIDESPGKARILIMKGLGAAQERLAAAIKNEKPDDEAAARADIIAYNAASKLLDDFSGSSGAQTSNQAPPPKDKATDVITGKKKNWTVPKE